MSAVEPNVSVPRRSGGRAFYAAAVSEFLVADGNAIIGELSSRQVAFHQSAEAEQIRAWEREIDILRAALVELGHAALNWRLLMEMPLLRLGQRLDALLVTPDLVVVIEFKIGAYDYDAGSRVQTERYAQSLRDFHEASQRRLIIPILCVRRQNIRDIRGVSLAESGPHLGLISRRRFCGVASADVRSFGV